MEALAQFSRELSRGLSIAGPDQAQEIIDGPAGRSLFTCSKIAANGLMATDQGLWRNGRVLHNEEILGPDSRGGYPSRLPSDSGAWLITTAEHAETGQRHALLLVKVDLRRLTEMIPARATKILW